MNTNTSLLLLLADLNAQVRTLQAENSELIADNARLKEELER